MTQVPFWIFLFFGHSNNPAASLQHKSKIQNLELIKSVLIGYTLANLGSLAHA